MSAVRILDLAGISAADLDSLLDPMANVTGHTHGSVGAAIAVLSSPAGHGQSTRREPSMSPMRPAMTVS